MKIQKHPSIQCTFIGHFTCWHVYTWRYALQSSPRNACYIASATFFPLKRYIQNSIPREKPLTWFYHISATSARLVYVNISRYYKCLRHVQISRVWPLPFLAYGMCRAIHPLPLTILTFTSHSPCNVFLIHPWCVTVTCAFREFTSDPHNHLIPIRTSTSSLPACRNVL